MRSPREDFAIPSIRDELKYSQRQELFQDSAMETVSLRHARSETALPMRRLGSFVPGTNVGGAGTHWNGATWRCLETDYVLKSHYTQKYGRNFVPPEMTIQDFGVTYAELEPHYDKFEKLCGVSGQAGNLRGAKVDGGNIFEGPRANDFPNKPLQRGLAGVLFEEATKKLGYHPFPQPSANASAAYTNPEGAVMGECVYCGFCERFGCESNAKASPNVNVLSVMMGDPKFELRTHAYVKNLVYDRRAKRVKSVIYVDPRNGEEYEQPANIVILGAYVFNNVLLMLTAGIGRPYDPVTGRGVVGKNYCYQYTDAGVSVFFEDKENNPLYGDGCVRHDHRRFQRRQFRSFRSRLYRRRSHFGRDVERPADRDARHASGNAALGQGVETGDCEMVPALVQRQRNGVQLRPPRELSRSRSDI